MAVKHTIKLKKYLDIIWEFFAYAAIRPGMLLELHSSGKVRAHSHLHGNAIPMFALEDELQGKGIDDAYAANDPVQVWVANAGEKVYALLSDGENVAIGNFLVSNGDGYLQKYAATGASDEGHILKIVGMALEAIDRSGSSGEDTNTTGRIEIMVV